MSKGLDCGCKGRICVVSEHFVGSTLPTPKGGVLTVIGLSARESRAKYYKTRCSICSEDTELFPDLFESKKDHLLSHIY